MTRLTCLVLSLACLSACSDEPITPEPSAVLAAPLVQGFPPAGAVAPDLHAMSAGELAAYHQALMDFQVAVTTAAAGAETWQQADQAVQRALATARASDARLPDYQLESVAATHMLARALQPGRASEAPLSDVATYTEMLLRNESPNAPIIADALTMLQGTWDAETVRTAARSTLDAVEHMAATEAARRAGGPSAGADDLTARSQPGAADERAASAVRRLDALADA